MPVRWIVAADQSRARIFEVAPDGPKDVSWFNTRIIDAYVKSKHLGA